MSIQDRIHTLRRHGLGRDVTAAILNITPAVVHEHDLDPSTAEPSDPVESGSEPREVDLGTYAIEGDFTAFDLTGGDVVDLGGIAHFVSYTVTVTELTTTESLAIDLQASPDGVHWDVDDFPGLAEGSHLPNFLADTVVPKSFVATVVMGRFVRLIYQWNGEVTAGSATFSATALVWP